MSGFLSALGFLTIIPVGGRRKGVDSRSLAYFPVVGLVVGLALAGLMKGLEALGFNALVPAAVAVVASIVITGSLHLDGLADTFDGLMSMTDRPGKLEVMRDPRVGTMGVAAIACDILLKTVLLASIRDQSRFSAVILMFLISRWALVFSVALFPYARESGKASVFMRENNMVQFAISTGFTLIGAVLIGALPGAVIVGLTALITYAANTFIKRELGGITGDTLGAVSEISEISVLAAVLTLTTV